MHIQRRETLSLDRVIQCPRGAFTSYRMLLRSDGMGFGLHETVIHPGGPYRWHYRHHKEACYCIAGKGSILSEWTGERHVLDPGTCYVLDAHEPHTVTAITELVLISVFYPALEGSEVHDADGSYSLGTDGDRT